MTARPSASLQTVFTPHCLTASLPLSFLPSLSLCVRVRVRVCVVPRIRADTDTHTTHNRGSGERRRESRGNPVLAAGLATAAKPTRGARRGGIIGYRPEQRKKKKVLRPLFGGVCPETSASTFPPPESSGASVATCRAAGHRAGLRPSEA